MNKYLSAIVLSLVCLTMQAQFYVVDANGDIVYSQSEGLPSYITFEKPTEQQEDADAVDLGLSSGLLWADRNVGAMQVSDRGDYYAWGETFTHYQPTEAGSETIWKDGREGYDWNTYLHCTENGRLKKYVVSDLAAIYGYEGKADNKKEIIKDDDVASYKWEEGWRMPTKEEFQELYDECNWQWTDDYLETGVAGYIVSSKQEDNDNSIFLPAAGYWKQNDLYDVNHFGYYWTKTLAEDRCDFATYLFFYEDYVGPWHNGYRYMGLVIRPVRKVAKAANNND